MFSINNEMSKKAFNNEMSALEEENTEYIQELTQNQSDYFYKKVELVKHATGYDGIIANGNINDSDRIAEYDCENKIITISNKLISDCFLKTSDEYDDDFLIDIICYEIACTKYVRNNVYRTRLNQELYNKVKELESVQLYKEMKIKSIRLSCFIYLVTSAVTLFLQNFRKIPQNTDGFVLGYTVNILGIEFNTQVLDGRIIFIALGRFGFLVNNIYNVYDTILDIYKCFCEYYSYFTYGYTKLIEKLYKNNEYVQNRKRHDLVFKMYGTYNEKIEKGV